MGARNHSGVRIMWGHLPDGAYRMLSEMAQTALDDDGRDIRGQVIPARRWFGGEDTLVTYVRSHNDRGEVRSHAAKKSAAYRFLRQLIDAGAVKVVRAAAAGDRSWYALNVDPLGREEFEALEDRAIDRAPKTPARRKQSPSQSDTAESEPVGHSESEPVGHSESEPVGHTPYASREEVLQELPPRTTAPEVSTSPAAVDDSEQGELTTETANRELIQRHGLEHALSLLDQHAATCHCANPAAHVLTADPALAVRGVWAAPDKTTPGGVTPSLLVDVA